MRTRRLATALIASILFAVSTTAAQTPPVDMPPPSARVSEARLRQLAIEKPEPALPRMAETAGVSGKVIVEIIVDREGLVEWARATSGHPLLRDAAVEAARKWTFRPAMRKNGPIRIVGTLTFTFPRKP